MVATHLGVVDEEQINSMSYIFFEDVLEQLGQKLQYDAVTNYAGNSFVKDSWEMIQDANPFFAGDGKHMSSRQAQTMADFFNGARIATKEDLANMSAVKAAGKRNKG